MNSRTRAAHCNCPLSARSVRRSGVVAADQGEAGRNAHHLRYCTSDLEVGPLRGQLLAPRPGQSGYGCHLTGGPRHCRINLRGVNYTSAAHLLGFATNFGSHSNSHPEKRGRTRPIYRCNS